MNKPLLIIVSGAPASGKTTLSKMIAKEFCLPVFSKDGFKETMADCLGCEDAVFSSKLGLASFALIEYVVNSIIPTKKVSFIVETNFDSEFASKFFNEIKINGDYRILQLYCHAPDEILFDRFAKRDESGDRHDCHKFRVNSFNDYKQYLLNREHRLNLDDTIDIDTSDFDKVDYETVFNEISKRLSI